MFNKRWCYVQTIILLMMCKKYSCRFFWFGDSGQGDIEMGTSMLNLHPGAIGGVYIHDVFCRDNCTPKSSHSVRNLHRANGVCIVDTYVLYKLCDILCVNLLL